MNELTFHNFNKTADLVGGDMMLILTASSSLEEIASQILSNKIIWFYDGDKYHQVMAFKDEPNAITIYFFNSEGIATSYRFGDD
jgi:hypothetical protein